MREFYITYFFLFSIAWSGFGQITGDECAGAIRVRNVIDWCSDEGFFTSAGATESPEVTPRCFAGQSQKDVWFFFEAEATTVNISITGQTLVNSGGTLRLPQFILYEGSCGNLTQLGCQGDDGRRNFVDAFINDLNIGAVYYLRVSAEEENSGTFRLCINNYNAIPAIDSDCSTGTILCDKTPFTVDFIDGHGREKETISDVLCGGLPIDEVQSTWLKWTCKDPGTLTFTITPINQDDDIDWALYELPGGVNDCSTKNLLRYNISGRNLNNDVSTWRACIGATGTAEGDPDNSEECGCQPGDNNFSKAADLERDKSYTLVIFNFSQSGAGYSISFGGTSTFQGPEVDFNLASDSICIGSAVNITDASFFSGGIKTWTWDFGQNALSRSANGQGPHTVSFNKPGVQSVLLTVEANSGCLVSKIKRLNVVCCEDHFTTSGEITPLACPDIPDGAIDLSVSNNFGPYTYEWDAGPTTEDLNGLEAGTYEVSITDQVNCQTTLSFTVNSPPSVVVDTIIGMPTCNGGTDGSITLNVSGATPGYEYNWQRSGFSADNVLPNLPIGDYEVIIRDANACEFPLTIPVRELELILDPAVQAITPPSCTDFSDGAIEVLISNGRGPYRYDWQDGAGFVDENSLVNVAAGVYQVEVLDANLCRGNFTFNMEDHPPLDLQFDVVDVSCFGLSDGAVDAIVGGGVGGYQYQWGAGGGVQANRSNLPSGTYPITVVDANGCLIEDVAFVPQPALIDIEIGDITDVVCHNDATGIVNVVGIGGVAPYSFSVDGGSFQTSTSFTGLPAGNYTFTIRDSEGCEESVSADVDQPAPLIVDAGEDQTIKLGESAQIKASGNEFPLDFQWSHPEIVACNDCDQTEARPVNTTILTLTAVNQYGCTADDELTIIISKVRPIYIPNIFSPNDAGPNNFFTIYGGPGARSIKRLQIFDRWGELVFETENVPLNVQNVGWDGSFRGRALNNGVYVYIAEVEFIDDEAVMFSGDVTLYR